MDFRNEKIYRYRVNDYVTIHSGELDEFEGSRIPPNVVQGQNCKQFFGAPLHSSRLTAASILLTS